MFDIFDLVELNSVTIIIKGFNLCEKCCTP